MKRIWKLFQIGLKQIAKDGMLLVMLPIPFIAGLFFKLAMPFLNGVLEDKLAFSILPWYGLCDGMLICLAPMLVAMVSAFLLLDERGEGVSAFYQISPAGGCCYLAARVGLPLLWSFAATFIAAALFHLSPLSPGVIVTSTIVSTFTGAALAMMVVSIAENRVEGLAISKLTGLSFSGLIVVWLLPPPYSYLCSFLPSFWVGKLILEGAHPLTFLFGVVTCLLWIALFSKRFLSRI